MNHWASTERAPAEIRLADGGIVAGELHLQSRVAHRSGPETVLEMLNRPDPFFPLSLADGGIVFLSKAQVAVVTCGPGAGEVDPDRTSAAKQVGLEVGIRGGDELRGWATLELPPTRLRALDYLNAAGVFFAVRTHARTHFINRAHARLVRPLD